MRTRGFTLLEMSIVIAVIGLIVGAIMGGADLMRSVELRNIGKDMAAYRAAASSFRDKYRGMPGDLANATSYWGAANSTPSLCAAALGTGVAGACNGDGDGVINDTDRSAHASPVLTAESFYAWQHLSLSGLIDPLLNGKSGVMTVGLNLPRTPRDGVTFVLTTTAVYGKVGMGLRVVRPNLGTGGVGPSDDAAALSISDARALDAKLDDGFANSGSIYGVGDNDVANGGAGCTGSPWSNTTGSDYLTAATADPDTDRICALTLWLN